MAVIEAISTTYLDAPAASIGFTSIPGTYKHLQLRISIQDEAATSYTYLYLRFNGYNTDSIYTRHWFQAVTATKAGSSSAAQTRIGPAPAKYPIVDKELYSGIVVDILDYTNTNKNTTAQYTGGVANNNSARYGGASTSIVMTGGVMWDNTLAITDIVVSDASGLSADLARGTVMTLYGIND